MNCDQQNSCCHLIYPNIYLEFWQFICVDNIIPVTFITLYCFHHLRKYGKSPWIKNTSFLKSWEFSWGLVGFNWHIKILIGSNSIVPPRWRWCLFAMQSKYYNSNNNYKSPEQVLYTNFLSIKLCFLPSMIFLINLPYFIVTVILNISPLRSNSLESVR